MRFSGLFDLARREREFAEELESHLALHIEDNLRAGMSPEEARRQSLIKLGGVMWTRELHREQSGLPMLETLLQDLRFGVRILLKNPGFTLVAVLTLALGIGANTAIFSVVNKVLLKPLPYADPQQLVSVAEFLHGEESRGDVEYVHWQAESKAFDHLAAYIPDSITLTGRGEPERLDAVRATANLFPLLGVAPQLGRAFTPEEDRPGAAPVVILSHAFWQRGFGADPGVIGQSLRLDGESRLVIGVMPPGFKFIRKADVLLPRALNVPQVLAREPGDSLYVGYIIGRLKQGVSPDQARLDLEAILRRFKSPNQKGSGDPVQARVTLLGESLVGPLRLGLLALFGAVAFILLIACANVANLMLARARLRQKEMAIRAALGAGRGRLVRQLLTESLLLSILGGVAGLLLALLGVRALLPLIPDNLAHLKESGIDAAALGFTFFASLLAGIVAGLIPALQTSRIDLNEGLKEGAHGVAFSKRRSARRVSPALMIGELALTLALLVGAGLLIKSFLRARAVEPGYNPENVLSMTIPLYSAGYGSAQEKAFAQDLLTRINSLPGVKVAAIGTLPLRAGERPSEVSRDVCCYNVSVDYFRALGLPLRAGRAFTEQDHGNAPSVVVINETYARRHFAGEDPIGQRINYGDYYNRQRVGTIVGVVADVKRFGLESGVQDSEQYHSFLQDVVFSDAVGNINLLIRTGGDPLKLAPAVRQQVWTLNPDLPVVDLMMMEQRLAASVAPRRFQMLLFGLFAIVALLLAAVGVYGVISYSVSRRTHEIGVRMALGAHAGDVLRLVVGQELKIVAIGVGLGVAGAFALTRLMKALLFEVSATDPVTFASGALLLILVALVACWIPARRATKVDPMIALRCE